MSDRPAQGKWSCVSTQQAYAIATARSYRAPPPTPFLSCWATKELVSSMRSGRASLPLPSVTRWCYTHCGRAGSRASCASGRPTQCREGLGVIDTPFEIDGRAAHQFANTSVFVERTVVGEGQVVRVDSSLPMPVAALLGCGVITGTGAVFNRARVRIGETVVVIGVGGVGLNALQAARLSGASRVVAVDINSAKATIASTFGATDFVIGTESVRSDVLDATGGGADHVIVCIGSAPLVALAVELLAPGGQAIIVGFPGGGAQGTFDMAKLYQDKSILACRYGTSSPRRDIPMLARLYSEGRLLLDELVTKTLPLESVDVAFADMANGEADGRSILTLM